MAKEDKNPESENIGTFNVVNFEISATHKSHRTPSTRWSTGYGTLPAQDWSRLFHGGITEAARQHAGYGSATAATFRVLHAHTISKFFAGNVPNVKQEGPEWSKLTGLSPKIIVSGTESISFADETCTFRPIMFRDFLDCHKIVIIVLDLEF